MQADKNPPPLAGHTLTLRSVGDKESLLLIGGFSPDKGFLDEIWEFDLQNNQWKTIKIKGYGPSGKYFTISNVLFHYLINKSRLFGQYDNIIKLI